VQVGQLHWLVDVIFNLANVARKIRSNCSRQWITATSSSTSVTARKDDAPAAVQETISNSAVAGSISPDGGLIQTAVDVSQQRTARDQRRGFDLRACS